VALSILLFVPRAARLKASELVVGEDNVVREKVAGDPPCRSFVLYDLEGEVFFGAAPELERYFNELTRRATAEGVRCIVLRVKRVRNPDVVCLERLEHFLKSSKSQDITVLLAGVRPDLLEAMRRLRFEEWFPDERIFLQGTDEDSATLAAIRSVYRSLEDAATACEHCTSKLGSSAVAGRLYYRV